MTPKRPRSAQLVQVGCAAAMVVAVAFRLDAVEFAPSSVEQRHFGVIGLTFFSAARDGRYVVFGAALASLLAVVQLALDIFTRRRGRSAGLVLATLSVIAGAAVIYFVYRVGFATDPDEPNVRPGWGAVVVLIASVLYVVAGAVRVWQMKASPNP